jgi:hypothetical protein
MSAADVSGRCLFMVVGLCFGTLLTWRRHSPAGEFDSTSHSDITKQLKRMKLHDPGAIPSLGTPDGSLGGWSAMKGGNKLSAEQRATLLASSKSVGSLVKIEQVNEPSPVAKEEGWIYEVKLSYTCDSLFRHKSENVSWPPPKWNELPKEYRDEATLGGNIFVIQRYYAQRFNGGGTNNWNPNGLLAGARLGKAALDANPLAPAALCPAAYKGYNGHCEMWRKYASVLQGKHGVVIGSQSPWIEASLLAYGVERLTTMEYSSTKTNHPQIRWIHPATAASSFLKGELTQFDFAVSYSSLEHDGLSRYGDPLNPNGDVESVQKVWCMLKPGGLFFLGFPYNGAHDELVFNSHRVYGPKRLPLVTANFEVLEVQEYIEHQGGNHTLLPKKADHRWPAGTKPGKETTDAEGKPLGERFRVQPLIALRKLVS